MQPVWFAGSTIPTDFRVSQYFTDVDSTVCSLRCAHVGSAAHISEG
jgi:hypothetical protein